MLHIADAGSLVLPSSCRHRSPVFSMTHPIIQGPTGGVAAQGDPGVFRLEIRDLAQDKYKFSLFIQALRESLSI